MSAAENVYNNIGAIIKYCNEHPGELKNLLDEGYSKKMFGINFRFFIDVNDIDESNPKTHPKSFKKDVYTVGNRKVRVTTEWFYKDIPRFKEYLSAKGIKPLVPIPEGGGGKIAGGRKAVKKNNRYKGIHIGNAQNLVIRTILSSLGNESFGEDDWEKTKKYFGNTCAYCGADDTSEMDHAIPINKEKLGEHRIGNIVPACKKCNSTKAGKDYKEFLKTNTEALHRIETYMRSKQYTPLTERENYEQLRKILNVAYQEVSSVAERYIEMINDLSMRDR